MAAASVAVFSNYTSSGAAAARAAAQMLISSSCLQKRTGSEAQNLGLGIRALGFEV